MKIKNLQHKKFVDTKELIRILWVNDGTVNDLNFEETQGKSLKLRVDLQEKMNDSWNNLVQRAKGQGFNLTNDPALQLEKVDVGSQKLIVSKTTDYRTIVSVRSQKKIYEGFDGEPRPNALVIVSILISSDNKLILGQRNFYGDWEVQTYESPGAFLSYKDLENKSAIKAAGSKIINDFEAEGRIQVSPFAIYSFPRILETVIICIAKIDKKANSLSALKYKNIITCENSKEGLKKIIEMPLNQFHPPSRTALQYYYDNFSLAQKIIRGPDK